MYVSLSREYNFHFPTGLSKSPPTLIAYLWLTSFSLSVLLALVPAIGPDKRDQHKPSHNATALIKPGISIYRWGFAVLARICQGVNLG